VAAKLAGDKKEMMVRYPSPDDTMNDTMYGTMYNNNDSMYDNDNTMYNNNGYIGI